MEVLRSGPRLTAKQQHLYEYLVFCHFEGHYPLPWQVMRRMGLKSEEEVAALERELAQKGLLEKGGERYRISGT